MIFRFGSIAPLKKWIISEQDKEDMLRAQHILGHNGGQCPPLSHFFRIWSSMLFDINSAGDLSKTEYQYAELSAFIETSSVSQNYQQQF